MGSAVQAGQYQCGVTGYVRAVLENDHGQPRELQFYGGLDQDGECVCDQSSADGDVSMTVQQMREVTLADRIAWIRERNRRHDEVDRLVCLLMLRIWALEQGIA